MLVFVIQLVSEWQENEALKLSNKVNIFQYLVALWIYYPKYDCKNSGFNTTCNPRLYIWKHSWLEISKNIGCWRKENRKSGRQIVTVQDINQETLHRSRSDSWKNWEQRNSHEVWCNNLIQEGSYWVHSIHGRIGNCVQLNWRFYALHCLWLYYTWIHLLGGIITLTLRRRIKSHLLFAGIIRSSPFSPR